MKNLTCSNCHGIIAATDKFCPGCGNPVLEESTIENRSQKTKVKTIQSNGNYSGKMTRGKKSKGWKIIRNSIVAIILAGIIALLIWFLVDPDAGKKLTDIIMGIAFMAVLFFVGWIFTRGKKRKTNYDWDDDQYADVSNDDD